MARRYPIHIVRWKDGDTPVAQIAFQSGCPPMGTSVEFSIRLPAVDSAESNPSGKKIEIENQLTKMIIDRGGLPAAWQAGIQKLVAKRVQYTGKVGALVANATTDYLTQRGFPMAAGDSYTFFAAHGGDKKQGFYDMADGFGRGIQSLHAPAVALADFMQLQWPVVMATEGTQLETEYRTHYTALWNEVTASLGGGAAQKLALLSPDTIRPLRVQYSPEVGTRLAQNWRGAISSSGVGDDMIAAFIQMGAHYYYPKYKNQFGAAYERIRAWSKQNQIGLWNGDPLWQLQDPMVRAPVAESAPSSQTPSEWGLSPAWGNLTTRPALPSLVAPSMP